jgi:hypothetical protein
VATERRTAILARTTPDQEARMLQLILGILGDLLIAALVLFGCMFQWTVLGLREMDAEARRGGLPTPEGWRERHTWIMESLRANLAAVLPSPYFWIIAGLLTGGVIARRLAEFLP